MKIFYGKTMMKTRTLGGEMLERRIDSPNNQWYLEGTDVLYSAADTAHATGENRHYLMGLMAGARGVRGFDSKIVAKLEEIRDLVYDNRKDELAKRIIEILRSGRV